MSTDVTTMLQVMQSNTFTVADMYRRLGLLRQCVESTLYTESEMSFLEACAATLMKEGSEEDAHAVASWGEAVLTSFTRDTIGSKIASLHTAVDELPLLTLYIPVEFPDEEIAEIGKWCRAECNEALFMDVHIDPLVVGGCAFVWNDTYHELSFRTRISDHEGVITNMLSGYGK